MGRPAKCVTVQEGKDLQKNYRDTKGTLDSYEVVYSLDELQEFLDYVRELSSEQNIAKPGIRIYYAAYDLPQPNKGTVLLSATEGTAMNAPNNYSIDPMNRGMGGWPPNQY